MKNKVEVYLSYGDLNYCTYKKLGNLTLDQVLDLQKQLERIAPMKIRCPYQMHANLEYLQTSHRDTLALFPTELTYTIRMSFWYKEERADCCKKYLLRDARQMTKMCARNLKKGKCQDPVIRQTIGAALFPQFYGKDKQK